MCCCSKIWTILSWLMHQHCAYSEQVYCNCFNPLPCSDFCRLACGGGFRSPHGTPTCPDESEKLHSWLWTGCTCGTVLVLTRLHTASHATGGRDQKQACASRSAHSSDTSCTNGHPPLPNPSLPDQILLECSAEKESMMPHEKKQQKKPIYFIYI